MVILWKRLCDMVVHGTHSCFDDSGEFFQPIFRIIALIFQCHHLVDSKFNIDLLTSLRYQPTSGHIPTSNWNENLFRSSYSVLLHCKYLTSGKSIQSEAIVVRNECVAHWLYVLCCLKVKFISNSNYRMDTFSTLPSAAISRSILSRNTNHLFSELLAISKSQIKSYLKILSSTYWVVCAYMFAV